jgi:hypothetical protein
MADFQTRIQDLIGVPSQGADNQLVTDSLNDAIKDIINLAPDELLWSTSTTSGDITSNSYSLSGVKVLGVVRENGVDGQYVTCKEVPFGYERKVQDVNSMFYPSKTEPVFFRKDSAISVFPAPAASPNAFKVTYINYPTTTYDASTIGTPNKKHIAVTVTDEDPAVFTCGETITFANGDIVTLSNFATSTDYNGVTTTVNNVGTDGTNKFRLNGLSSSGAGTGGTVETATSGFPEDWITAVIYGAALKICNRLIADWVLDEDPEMVQTTTAIVQNIKELYTLELQILFPKPQAGG